MSASVDRGAPNEWVDTLLDAFYCLPKSGEWLIHLNGGSTYWDSHFPDTLFSEMIDVVLEEVQSGGKAGHSLTCVAIQEARAALARPGSAYLPIYTHSPGVPQGVCDCYSTSSELLRDRAGAVKANEGVILGSGRSPCGPGVTRERPCSSAVAAINASGSLVPNRRRSCQRVRQSSVSTSSSRNGASTCVDRSVAVLPANSSARVTTE